MNQQKCRCGCEQSWHELRDGILRCKNHPEIKCPRFRLDAQCRCEHYKTSHDVLGRCHVYMPDGEMCGCDDYHEVKGAEN
jgi:hypothetical protein